jgi:MscS family membrane protein
LDHGREDLLRAAYIKFENEVEMESLEGFGKEVVKVWQTGVLGVNLGEIIIALAVIFVFLAARRLFYQFVTSSLKAVTRKTKTDLDDLILDAIEKPLEFAFVVVGLYFAGQIISFPATISGFFDKIVRSLIAFTIFWALFRALTPLSSLFDRGIGLFGP